MISKQIFQALIAFAFAVCSAFASMSTDETVFVWAKETMFEEPTCIATTANCDNQESTSLCQLVVSVRDFSVTPQTVASTGTLKSYKSGCVIVLFDHANRGPQLVDASTSIYHILSK